MKLFYNFENELNDLWDLIEWMNIKIEKVLVGHIPNTSILDTYSHKTNKIK